MKTLMIAIAVACLMIGPSAAQENHGGHGQSAMKASPYAGFESRRIKSLSDEQISDLQSGRGMCVALAAELNGFPGPTHVLELAGELGLSEAQRVQTEAAVRSMKSETIAIGKRIVAAELELDRLFAERRIDRTRLTTITTRIGTDQGELRDAHLNHHIAMVELLDLTSPTANVRQPKSEKGAEVQSDLTAPRFEFQWIYACPPSFCSMPPRLRGAL